MKKPLVLPIDQVTVYEIGYTPRNLALLLKRNKIKQKEVYEYIGKSRASFERYLVPVDDARHVSMPHPTWLLVNEYVTVVQAERMLSV